MKFNYSVRRLFSQGVLNDALLQPQTYPMSSYLGTGTQVQRQFMSQPGAIVDKASSLLYSVYGAGAPTGVNDLTHLVGQGKPGAM